MASAPPQGPPASAIESAFRQVLADAPPELAEQLTPGDKHLVALVDGRTGFFRVPLNAGGRVRGFMDLTDAGGLVRYGFRGTGSPTLPQDLLEMTPDDIAAEARTINSNGDVSDPHLVTLDGASQVAWGVKLGDADAYVTPGAAWLASPEQGNGE